MRVSIDVLVNDADGKYHEWVLFVAADSHSQAVAYAEAFLQDPARDPQTAIIEEMHVSIDVGSRESLATPQEVQGVYAHRDPRETVRNEPKPSLLDRLLGR